MTTTDTLTELEKTGEDFRDALSSFDQKVINTVPFEGSWTAGEVAEHVLKSVSGILAGLSGTTRPTERNPREYAARIGDLFLNFETKLKNPDFLTPTKDPKDKNALLSGLERKFAGMSEAVRTMDLSLTCADREFPGVGPLTRLEWVYLVIYHTQRHTHQLKNIRKHL